VRRFIVFGAGAIGGVVGGRLLDCGEEVVLIARGAQREALAAGGLRLESPDGVRAMPVAVVGGPDEIAWRESDVVLLTVKGQDTPAALEALAAAAPPTLVVACLQNGVDNERLALRVFADVYAVLVQLPATFIEPGVVVAHSSPLPGVLDVGRYPQGLDERAHELAAAFRGAGFAAQARADIMRWKYAKLLRNVGNAVQALFGSLAAAPEVERRARAEAVAAFAAAGIAYVADAEYDELHARAITPKPVPGRQHAGGSSWQSLRRGSGTIETAQLNGEIVLLGRLHGVATPVNELLTRLSLADARAGAAPGGHTEAAFLAVLGADS
jgi:2-dehydropantoate 2-reductase